MSGSPSAALHATSSTMPAGQSLLLPIRNGRRAASNDGQPRTGRHRSFRELVATHSATSLRKQHREIHALGNSCCYRQPRQMMAISSWPLGRWTYCQLRAKRRAGYTASAMSQVDQQLDCLLQTDRRYHVDGFAFLLAGLETTATRRHGPRRGKGSRHISGRELSLGLRDIALDRWGIRRTRDFGEMVFLLIGAGLLGKQPSDRIEDFDDVYDFAAAFEHCQKRIS